MARVLPHNRGVLPQLPLDLPAAPSLPSVPPMPALPGLPEFLSQGPAWTWMIVGAAIAVVSLWALRKTRRMVVAATLSVAGLILAWNAGFLPLSA